MPLTSENIKKAEEYEQSLSGLLESPDSDEYEQNSAAYNKLGRAIDDYYKGQRQTDGSGKLTAPPETRSPATVDGDPTKKEFAYHFEPSVAEVQTMLKGNPSLVKLYKLERWMKPEATPRVATPMNVDIPGNTGIGTNIQEPQTFVDTMTTDSSPYTTIADHMWAQKADQAKAAGVNLKRYRDIHLVKGQGEDFLRGGLEYNIDRRLAPGALGLADAYTGGAASPLYDMAAEHYNRRGPTIDTQSREDTDIPEVTDVPDPMSGQVVGTNESGLQSEGLDIPYDFELPLSQEIKDRSPGIYHGANFLAYGLPGNPANLLQETIAKGLGYGEKTVAGMAARHPVTKAVISGFAGGTTNAAEGAVRDTATGLQQGKEWSEIAKDVGLGIPVNTAFGTVAGSGFDLIGQGAGKYRDTFRRQNKDIQTMLLAGGDTSVLHGTKPSPEVENYVRQGTRTVPRPEGSPGALAAEAVAPKIEESLNTQDVANNKRIGDEMEEYFNHPAYRDIKATGQKLVTALVEMAQKGEFRSPVKGKSANLDPGLVRTVNKELSDSPWAEPRYVSRADAGRVAADTNGVEVDLDTAQKMFGDAEGQPAGTVAIIVPTPMSARELTALEDKVAIKLKYASDNKVPADPVYVRLDEALKDTRDEFPVWRDENGKLVDPPVDEGPRQPFGQSTDVTPPKGDNGPGGVSVLPNVRIEAPVGEGPASRPGLGPGQPELPGTFDQRAPADPGSPLEAMARPIDIRGTSLDDPDGLLGVGPGQPSLPENPFDPRLPISREVLNPQQMMDVHGDFNEPDFIPPEAMPGPGPRRDQGNSLTVEPRRPVDVQGSYNEPRRIQPDEPAPATQRMPSGFPGKAQPTEDATPLSLLAGNKLAMDVPEPAAVTPSKSTTNETPATQQQLSAMFSGLDKDRLQPILSALEGAGAVPTIDRVHALKVAGLADDNVASVASPEFAGKSGRRALGLPIDDTVPRELGKPMPGNTVATANIGNAIKSATADTTGLAYVADVVKAYGGDTKAAHKAILEAERRGAIELRPEGGLNRLSKDELALTIPGPGKMRLSLIRVIDEDLLTPREPTERVQRTQTMDVGSGEFVREGPGAEDSLPGPMAKDWSQSKEDTKNWYEDILSPGRETRSGETKRMADLSDQQRAMEEALGKVNDVDRRLGPMPEKDKEKMLLEYISKKLGREVTREDLVRAGIIAGGAAASVSDDEDVQNLGTAATVIGSLGGHGKPKPKRPTQPEATLDNGKVVKGFSAMRRKQAESKTGLETTMKRVGVNSDKTLRDRLIEFHQGNNKLFDDALEEEAKKLGLSEELWTVPAAGQQVEMERNRSFIGGTSGRGMVGRTLSSAGPRADALAGILSGAGRNPYEKGPPGLMEAYVRNLFNLTGGRSGARHGDDIQAILGALFGEDNKEEKKNATP